MRAELLTPIRRFLAWWLAELRACVPGRLANAVFGSHDSLELQIGHDAALRLTGDRRRLELGRLRLDDAALPESAKRARKLARQSGHGDRRATVRLPGDRVLRPRIELPIAAAENLSEALAFEMDRHTPFAAEDVFFDFNVAGTDPEMQRLQVDLEIARRQDVREALEITNSLGLRPARITGPAEGEADAGFNLLPLELRASRGRLLPRLTGAMAILTILLALAVLGSCIERKERLLARTADRAAELRAEAGAATQQQERLDRLMALSRFVSDERQRRPLAVAVIDEISRRLPDQHWLTGYAVRDGTLQVTGFSEDPSDLLRRLEDSDLLNNARFAAPVTRDARRSKETFSVIATITGAGAGD